MSTIRRFKYLIVLILIPFILTTIWFRNGLIVGGGEEGLIFYNPGLSLKISQSTWVDYNSGIPNLYWLPRTPFLLLASILVNNFGLPSYLVQAGLFFVLMTVGVISVYCLTLNLLDKYASRFLVSFIAAIFYLFNPFSVSQVWGRGLYPFYFSFALLPLSLLFLLKGLKNKQFIYIIPMIFSSVVFSNAFGTVTFVVTYWVVLFLFFLWWLFVNKLRKNEIIFGLLFLGLLFITWSIVSSWWLLPLIIEGNKIFIGYLTNSAENLGTLLGVSRNFTPDIIIRLLQRTYYFDVSAFSPMYRSFFFQLISFIPLIFVLIGFVKIFRKLIPPGLSFYAILLILGLIVSLGANPPFGWLFVWMFKKISILQAFRNPFEKFGLVYALGYCAVFAFGLVSFFENKRFKNLGMIIVLVITCGIFAWPMWTGRVLVLPDRKIGIDVPDYYQELNNWLKDHNKDGYRIMMTPILPGEGAFYKWNDTIYQGADFMIHILDYPIISNEVQIPFYYQFVQNIRKYMERTDLSGALSLLRVKFLVDRKDTISITEDEKKHYQFLTSAIFSPSNNQIKLKSICQNKKADSKSNGLSWIVCQIQQGEDDWKEIRYLRLKVLVDKPSTLEFALRDRNEVRIRWYGKLDPEYILKAGEWNYVTIPLHAPSEYNSNIDFSKIYLLEVLAYRLDDPEKSVGEITLEDVKLDSGKQDLLSSFDEAANFGKLDVFSFKGTEFPPEFGVLSSVERVKNFPELFDLVNTMKDSLSSVGFIVGLQNSNKDTQMLSAEFRRQSLEKEKISNTRYWMKTDKEGEGLIMLSKTFNPEWKVIPNINKADTAGGFINDLRLLQKSVLSEENHFVVNGYANLWKVDSKEREYAIVFRPQIVADIGWKVSIFCIILLGGVTLVWVLKKYTFLR